jgi:hypothetical protein
MDSVQVALVTLAALVVGMLIPVMIQVWLTLRQVQQEMRITHAKIDPLLDEVKQVVGQLRSATQITSAVAMAVTAGVHAWRESKAQSANEGHDAP